MNESRRENVLGHLERWEAVKRVYDMPMRSSIVTFRHRWTGRTETLSMSDEVLSKLKIRIPSESEVAKQGSIFSEQARNIN